MQHNTNEYLYFNNAATSYPKPPQVHRAVANVLHTIPLHHARLGFGHNNSDVLVECRRCIASLLGANNPNTIAFSSGATASLNMALRGLPLQGTHVVTTAIEHNSVLRPLKTLEREGVLALTIVPCTPTGEVTPQAIEEAITAQTSAVVVSHCSNVTGVASDIQAIGHIAQQKGVFFVVDAAQSAGVLPIDVEAMNIDVLAFAGHKSLYGIQGIGGAYVRESLPLHPLLVGGTGVRSDYLYQPETIPMRYEAGTPNTPGIASLLAGTTYVLERGIDTQHQYLCTLCSHFHTELSDIDILQPVLGAEMQKQSAIFSFTINGIEPSDVGYMLEQSFGIIVRSGLHCAPLIHQYLGTPDGVVRISPSGFTSYNEVEQCIRALREICEAVQ